MSNDKTPAQAAEEEYPPMPFAKVPAHDLNRARRDAFIKGAEWQASQAPSPSVSVDQIMKVVNVVLDDYHPLPLGQERAVMFDLRRRLTALLDQTP